MDIKNAIIARKSVRKYDYKEIGKQTLDDFIAFLDGQKLPFEGDVSYKIIDKKTYDATTKGLFKVPAPYYIMFYADKCKESLLNTGYLGQMFCLYLASKNFGTCWLGGTTNKETVKDLPYVVCIAFGTPVGELRKSADEANRKTLDKITGGEINDKLLEILKYIQLAPSACNLQPWYFLAEQNKIHAFKENPSLFKIMGLKTMQQIDLGIVCSHFNVADYTIQVLEESAVPKLNGRTYQYTAVINS